MFVGRVGELRRAVDVVAGGRSLVIIGEAGVGKTALLDAALARLGGPVLAGQCFRSLARTAGLPLQQAVGRPVPAEDADHTARWLVGACRDAVLRIDDVQWADPLTLAVLAHLPPTICVAATVRAGDEGAATAVDTLSRLGAECIGLDPLDVDAAAELARATHPGLRPDQARALARRSGGNPLLVVELGASGEPSAGLRRTVVTRLRRLGTPVWQGFGMLALAAEPLPSGWLPDPDGLRNSGLVVDAFGDGTLAPRHPLLAEVAAAELAEHRQEQTVTARLLAAAAEDAGRPAIAAGARALAGDRASGLALALAAADASERPGERATLLHLAATCADQPESQELTVRAVRELVETGDYVSALTLLDRADRPDNAEWAALRGRLHWETGDDAEAVAAWERAVELAAPGTREAVRYQLELARTVLLGAGDAERAMALVHIGAAEAERLGVERARARCVRGTVAHFFGDEGCLDDLGAAVEMAAESGETEVEFTAVNNLVASLESMDRTGQACDVARNAAERAARLGLVSWQHQLTAMELNVRLHQGRYDRILEVAPPLLAGVAQRRTRDQVEVVLDLALVDTGRTDEALTRIEQAARHSADDRYGRGNLAWVRSEALLWSGDPAGATGAASEAMEAMSGQDMAWFPLLTLAYVQARAGLPLEHPEPEAPAIPILRAAPVELAAHAELATGDLDRAARCFGDAATLWAGRHRRGELRCRWLSADCDPDREVALERLRRLEHELAADGWAPLLGQVRRSLRARGVRSSAPRERAGALTAREREVLDLVAAGHSTAAVAGRLGLSPATVAAQVASARAKLGAATRRQAASDA